MRVSIRRTVRVGALAGTPVEDLGVVPDIGHRMTRDDVLHDNTDLLARAGEVLAALPSFRLDATRDGATLRLRTKGLDRVDVFVAGRPRASADVSDGDTSVSVTPAPGPRGTVHIEGYAAGILAAARTLVSGA
jgi:hypothetical protein